ncbi:hypothetical protein F511_35038 [Dorcoceras hygrometricum]|uniref:Uncharacterized protein n=1 Tax=Dorcoceras hygrometricum TaxID=472368 RepID=A0A2Z7B8Y2_9LAMI|nr:hypothetical protein F511_35038 [Dorcoceras hygrometricum]
MKYEYRLLNDILAKAITVKAGSFDAVTDERFLMMTAIQFGLKVNWSKILFGVLKEMVDKTHCVEEAKVESDEPVVLKKRRTTKSKASYSKASLDIVNVAQDVVPLQIVEPTPAATAEKSPLPKRKSKKRRLVLSKDSDDENVEEQESDKDTVAVAVEESTVVKHTDEVDVIIGQVLVETSQMGIDDEEQLEKTFDETNVEEIFFEDTAVDKPDNFEQWLDESYEDFGATETVDKTEGSKEVAVTKTPEKAIGRNQTDEELMSIDDLLMQISDNMMLPSVTAAEVTKIRLGSSIAINEVQDSDWYYSSLPRISIHDKGKEPLEEVDIVKGNPAREMVALI